MPVTSKTVEGSAVKSTTQKPFTESSRSTVRCSIGNKNSGHTWTWWIAFGTIILLTVWTRFHKVDQPDHVCWDETHFGKMGSWYINRTFFFDVHPPLGKMLIGLFGYLTGYDGTFPFNKPGDKYDGVQYVGMRVCCSAMGGCLVPFAFIIVWEMTLSLLAATFAAAFILFDVGVLTLSQYILLDPILLFFIMGAVLGMVKFESQKDRSFSISWWRWQVFTGVMLACAFSVKFVGLFVILLVGIHTIVSLWDILGDMSKSITYILKHFAARALCLIILPVVLYIAFFCIHLAVLTKSGIGDGFFSSAFQSHLEGNALHSASMPEDVAYGAVLTFRNHRTGGAYLHSHWHLYPEGIGARQQQVTSYSHKDNNNKFLVKKYNQQPPEGKSEEPAELVRNGDLIRLEHVVTKRNLHSHKEPAPLSKRHSQVTGYGENGTGDANDVWRLDIIGAKEKDILKTVRSKFRLIHYLQSCVLTCSGKQLPKWAYDQYEISCNPNMRDPNSLWNVEDNEFSKLPNVSFDVHAPSFMEMFMESHAVMLQGNAGLKPKEGEVTSRPWQWPINFRGQFFSAEKYRIYLLGNPIIWWGNLVFLFLFLMTYAYNAVWEQRGYQDSQEVKESKKRMTSACGWLFTGWMLHYIPFWAMGRVLYFHHYFPALLFSCMLTGVILDYLLISLSQVLPAQLAANMYHWLIGVIFSVLLYSFYLFSPLAYGLSGHSHEVNSTMHGLKWLDAWEF